MITTTARARPVAGYDDQVGFGTIDAAAAVTAARKLAAGHRARKGPPPVSSSSRFGAHSAAAPLPVGGRGRRWLVVLAALAAVSLVLAGASVWLLGTSRRRRQPLPSAGPGGPPGPGSMTEPGILADQGGPGPGGLPGPAGAGFPVPPGYSGAREHAGPPRLGSPADYATLPPDAAAPRYAAGPRDPGPPEYAPGSRDAVPPEYAPAPRDPVPPGHAVPPAFGDPVPRGPEAARTTVPRFGRSRPAGGRHAAPRDQPKQPGPSP